GMLYSHPKQITLFLFALIICSAFPPFPREQKIHSFSSLIYEMFANLLSTPPKSRKVLNLMIFIHVIFCKVKVAIMPTLPLISMQIILLFSCFLDILQIYFYSI